MTGTRLVLPALAVALLSVPANAGDGLIPWNKKTDAAKVKQLTETLRADSSERKRKAAAVELREYDARTHPELLVALVAALQKDAAAAVRAEAAESIAQSRLVNTVAGLALEAAAASDPARTVRDAAKQALWEYHLSGYRSRSGADGYAGQTPEPPLAKPPVPRPPTVRAVADTSPPPTPIPTARIPDVRVPSVLPAPAFDPPVVTAAVSSLPPPEPLAPPAPAPISPVVLVTAVPPPVLNLTAEPPLAKPLPLLPVRRPLPTYRPALGPTAEPPTAPGPTPSAPLGLPPIPATPAPPVKK